MSRVIAYIDGFNLYFGMRSKGWRRYYWLNLELLAENLLKPGQRLVSVKYFTARISDNPGKPGKHRRQLTYLDAVESLSKTQVFYGHFLPKKRQCFACGATWISHEEKMTDVNISVELLKDAIDHAFDTAVILSADSDLSAPLEFVRERFPECRLIVVSPPARQSKSLEGLAHASFRLGRKKLKDSQFPDRLVIPRGIELSRPEKWK